MIKGTVSLDSSFAWNAGGKSLSVTGDTLDITACNTISLDGALTVYDIDLVTTSDNSFYANGFSFRVLEKVTTSNAVTVLGGGTRTVASTDITLLSGTYGAVFGGGAGADVTGDVNITVGGNVNPDIDVADHSIRNWILGGSNCGKVYGNVNITFGGQAKVGRIYGGGNGASSAVLGKCSLHFTGGSAMGIYGGAVEGTVYDTQVVMTGGTVQQIFGGSDKGGIVGNTCVSFLGGSVGRRIFGGCYNEFDDDGIYTSDYHVTGSSTIILGPEADIAYNYGYDYITSACSRYKEVFEDETATVIFADGSDFTSKIGDCDWLPSIYPPLPSGNYTVKASEGGSVNVRDGKLIIIPDSGKTAVTSASPDITYTDYAEVQLPEKTDEVQIITVSFS